MQVVVVGLNHNSAPLVVRERATFSAEALPHALVSLRAHVDDGFILSTCNRTEVYAVAGHADSGAQLLTGFLAESRAFPLPNLRPYLYSYSHDAAVRHLLAVAAGLDSMVPGDEQILAQVKASLQVARSTGPLGPVLYRLGQTALAVGKRVRTHTAISRNPVSVVSVALQAAAAHFDQLGSSRVVVLGAGRTAELVLKHLAAVHPKDVTVVSRTHGRAGALAGRYGVRAAPWTALADALAEADLLVGCTGAPSLVVSAADLAAARGTGSAPLVCLDLSVPRDIDPEAAQLPDLTLYDMDRLQATCSVNRARRDLEAARATTIVNDGVERFMDWWRARRVAPSITRLRARAEAIRDQELSRALARLSGLGPREQLIIRGLAARIVNQLLHRPITTLKTDAEGANMARTVERLFELGPSDESNRSPRRAAEVLR